MCIAKVFHRIFVTILVLFNLSAFAQNEDIYDRNNYNPNVANGNIVIDDTQIASDVKQAIAADPHLSKLPVKVSSEQGVVSLKGKVNSEQQAHQLIGLVQSLRSVHFVDASQLTAAPVR